MRTVAQHVRAGPTGRRILDIPAGNGKLAQTLREAGNTVVCADINREHPDYVYADMSEALPFADGEFDVAICLEGVEHLVDPVPLIGELVRVTRPGGEIIVSTPNVSNFYSRLQFLFTGVFYQFNPADNPVVQAGELRDRGHIAPLTYFQLRFLFEHFGATVTAVLGDRWKKKALLPLYLVLLPLAWMWTRSLLVRSGQAHASRFDEMAAHMLSRPALFSRSLILVVEK
jgi:SAM-dependent methyltransferase